MKESRGQNRTGRTDPMTVGNCSAFDIHDVFGQSELSRHRDYNRGKRFITCPDANST
jgi:hypothetical protein